MPYIAVDPGKETGWVIGPGRVIETVSDMGFNPISLTDIFKTETERMLAASKVSENPVPFRDRLAFWQRAKARRAERAANRAREDQDISMWLAEKAPTPMEAWAQDCLDTTSNWASVSADGVMIVAGSITSDNIAAGVVVNGRPELLDQTPISSARRITRETVEAKIIGNVVDVDEVFWDVVSMIDAHRNGATALDDCRSREFQGTGDDPVWEELTATKWDPTKERGPREVDYVRRMAKLS